MAEWDAGRGPSPALLLALVWALPEDSLTKALMRGGREHWGWSITQYQLASIYNAVNVNTQATGNWAKKPPKFDPFPVPKTKKSGPRKKVSAKDMFNAFLNRS
jgi:hypothetical protein